MKKIAREAIFLKRLTFPKNIVGFIQVLKMSKQNEELGRVLVLGAGGYMGNFYIKSLLEMGINKDSIIGVDINPGNLAKVAKQYVGPIYTSDIEEAFSLKPEIAVVVVNSVAHLQVIKQCHQAGIRKIFVEKPLVYTEMELEELEKLGNLENLYTSYLINFSGAVDRLFQFIRENDLIVIETRSIWGKNWCAVPRPMGGDAEEEMPHSLALVLSAISLNQEIIDVDCFARLSSIPHVQQQYLEEAKKLDYGFPGEMNDSTIAHLLIQTKDRTIPTHFLTSFNMYEQIRRVELDLIRKSNQSGFGLPEFKVCLEFDVNGKDILRIKEAENEAAETRQEFSGDKLGEQLEAVLKVFAKGEVDSRLVGFGRSAWLVRLIQKVIEFT